MSVLGGCDKMKDAHCVVDNNYMAEVLIHQYMYIGWVYRVTSYVYHFCL